MAAGLVGIIGGTGLGDALAEHITDAEFCDIETPFGKPSASITVGRIGLNKIAFLNRHSKGHKLSPSEVPFAANIFALKKLGVHSLIGSGAVGSLREEIGPGDLVIVDQFIDKTFNDKVVSLAALGRCTVRWLSRFAGDFEKNFWMQPRESI